MNVICPIFLESPFEAELLRMPFGGEPYIDHVLNQLIKEDDVRLNILTDHKELYEHLLVEGFNAVWADAGGEPTPDFCPFSHFKLHRMKKWLGGLPLDGPNELVLMDIRFPLLTYSVLEEALGQYRRSKRAALVSVSQPVDHPAQTETYFSHVVTDIISMVDEEFDPNHFVEDAMARYGVRYNVSGFSGVCVSKPFFFNWEGYCVQPDVYNSLIYRIYDENLYSWPRPFAGTDLKELFARQSIGKYYLFEDSWQARRLYFFVQPRTGRDQHIKGLSFSKSLEKLCCLLSRGEDGTSVSLYMRDEYVAKNYLMRIETTLASPGKGSVDALLVDIDRHIADAPTLAVFGADFHETDIQLDCMMSGNHWIVTILENVSGGVADMSQPMQLENAPWHSDPKTKRKYDSATGRELTGRQLLSPVYKLDGAFLITDASYLSSFETEINDLDTEGFVLEEPKSKKIASEIDFLRSWLLEPRTEIEDNKISERNLPAQRQK